MYIIVKNYCHFNRALGKYIKSKSHYDYEMKKQGMVSLEEGNRLAEKYQNEKKWKPSKDCIDMIKTAKNASKNNTIILGQHPILVDAMKKQGMSFDMSKLPKHYQPKGGFN